ncbi:MAG: CPBP family intramembrane glutamic endopeptidase [Fimbriimonadales bacterium]
MDNQELHSENSAEDGQATGIAEPRNPVGWFSLAAILGFLVFVALSGYFSPQRAGAVSKSTAELALKSKVELGPAASVAGGADLASEALKLEPLAKKDAEAAFIYAAIQTEEKRTIEPGTLDSLRKSKSPIDLAAYEIYSSQKLTPERARYLASQLPVQRFVCKLAGVQALEKAGIAGARAKLAAPSRETLLVTSGLVVILFLGVGLVLLYAYLVARIAGRFEPLGFALGQLSLPNADKVAARCAQFFLLYLAIQFAGLLMVKWVPRDFVEVPMSLAMILGFVLLARLPAAGKRLGLSDLGINREHLGRHILWGVGGAIANIPVFSAVAYVSMSATKGLPSPEHPVSFELQDATSTLMILKIVFSASVAAPFIEEILFRGTFFPALAAVLRSPLWAGVITSLAFGMIHPTGIPVWAPLACIGGMSCFLAYQTKSLVPSMVMHSVHNLGMVILTLILLR